MTSQINPSNINGAYPVAGQDNNSQGFRDNFTNTGTNFQYAAQEITDLQNKAVLKAPLAGTVLDNNMLNNPLINALISDFAGICVSLGALSGAVAINYSAGHFYTVTTDASISLGFSNFPAAGQAGVVVVQITVTNVAHTVTFPSAVSSNVVGIVGLNSSTNTITFAAPGVYTFTFMTFNGGTTVSVFENNKSLQPMNASGETLTNGATVSLAVTGSRFDTTGAWTATLPDGVYGQIKDFIMSGYGGNMVITVTAAGWKNNASGTITFAAVGDSCLLRYLNDSWFCIGNNGCVFA